MKGDFSRSSFDPNNHYHSVRMQQGRVQLDADWNEQVDINDYRNRLFTEDFLGTAIAPANDAGFEVTIQNNPVDLTIGMGHYYVNGVLVENSALTSYQAQPDYPNAKLPSYNAIDPNDNIYLAYLDIWQRNVSMVDDPAMAEVALNGADTSVRTRNIAQVKLMSVLWDGSLEPLTYNNLFNIHAPVGSDPYQNALNWQTMLNRLNASPTSQLTPLLNSAPTLQNQLYRIEIHQSSGSQDDQNQPILPSFKWSRDNASVSAAITAISIDPSGNNSSLTITHPIQDGQMGFNLNQWLELTIPARELTGVPGDMVKIVAINGSTLTVEGTIGADIKPTNSALAYRWESPAIEIHLNAVNNLEDGLSIIFSSSGTDFKMGDYWIIPARAATNTLIWPQKSGVFQTQFPQGTQVYYAPLAIVQCNANGSWTRTDDCRQIATSLSRLGVYGADPEAPSNSVYVDRMGQVGIGTQTPTGKLNIVGQTLTDSLIITNKNTGSFSYKPIPDAVPASNLYGHISTTWLGDIWVPNIVAPLPVPTANFGAVSFNNLIYIFGGEVAHDPDRATNAGYVYNPISNSWSTLPQLNTARWGIGFCVVGSKIYALGGNAQGPYVSLVEVYDTSITNPSDPNYGWKQSTSLTSYPPQLNSARDGCRACVIGTKIYVVGGSIINNHSDVSLASIEVYDTSITDSSDPNYGWKQSTSLTSNPPSMNSPRTDFGLCLVGYKIYAIGTGRIPSLASVEVYDTSITDPSDPNYGWKQSTSLTSYPPQLNTARSYIGTCSVGNIIYAIGGTTNRDPAQGGVPIATVEIYDTSNANPRWQFLAGQMSVARSDLRTVPLNGLIYAMGGSPDDDLSFTSLIETCLI